MGVARLVILWAALMLLLCMPAFARDDDGQSADDAGGPSQGQYDQGDDGQAVCPGAVEVAQVGPESEGTVTPFRTTGRTFVVTYDVAFENGNDFGNVSIDIEDRFGLVEFENISSNNEGSGSYVVTEGAGSYDLVVNVEQSDDATYTVVVEDCRGSDDGPGDPGDPDDVVPGTAADEDLPDTGGLPLPATLFALALLVASVALLGASVRRDP